MNEHQQVTIFDYLFKSMHNREPAIWERIIGLALVRGELTVISPPRNHQLRQIHFVAEGVKAALQGRKTGQ